MLRFNQMRPFLLIPALALTVSGAQSNTTTGQPQGAAQPRPAASAVPPAPSGIALLEQDPALQAKVSFEVKRRLLSDLLADLTQQSGVSLTAAGNSPAAQARITARVKEMPLSRFMGALSRIYGITWSKADKGYVMNPHTQDDLHLKLLQTGHPLFYQYRNRARPVTDQRYQERGELARTILNEADGPELHAQWGGVPVANLSEDVQQRLRRAITEEELGIIVNKYRRTGALNQDCTVRMTMKVSREPDGSITRLPLLLILSPDGKIVTGLPVWAPSEWKFLEKELAHLKEKKEEAPK